MKGIFLNGTRCFTSHIELQALPMPWLQTQKSLGALLLNLESSMCVFQHGSGSKSLKEVKSFEILWNTQSIAHQKNFNWFWTMFLQILHMHACTYKSHFCLLLKIRLIQHLHRFRNSQSEFSKTWGGASWWWGGQWSVGCGFSSLSSSSSSSLGVTWSDIRCQDQLASSENQSPKPVECLESKIRQCESWKKMK